MDSLINDLLTYSRIGRRAVKINPVNVNELISQATEYLADLVRETGAKITVEGDFCELLSDSNLIERILVNLLENALTSVRDGDTPEILIRGRSEPGAVIVTILDN